MNEDGLIEPWLKQHCGSDPRVADLCKLAPKFPRDSQELLWGVNSPFQTTVWEQRMNHGIDWDAQLGIAARGALLLSPGAFVREAADATIEQYFSFRVLDDECPSACLTFKGAMQFALYRFKPKLAPVVNAAPQIRGVLPRSTIEAITSPVSWAGLLGIFLLVPLAWRRRDRAALSLLLALHCSLLANAFVTGALSDVHDRYQSRLIWLAPVTCLLILLRWRAQRRGMADAP
jgi:hypothetical protein